MAASASAPRGAAAALPPIPLRRRLYGLGSVYGKTVRDSRLSLVIAAGLFGGLALALGAAIGTVFPTPEVRTELGALVGAMPPAMVSMFGNVALMGAKLGTLGGYVTWKYGALFSLGAALWSILALSGTLAGESARGGLDIVATSPFGRRRIAAEKVAAHLTAVWIALAVLAVMQTVSSDAFGDAALGDRIPLASSAAFSVWVGVIALFFGGLTLVLGPFLGRGGSAGASALAMLLAWLAAGLDVGGPLRALSPFAWTWDNIPLVGIYDWGPVILVGAVGAALVAGGIELFARRDLGVTSGLSLPPLPGWALGVRGPVSRAFGDQLPRSLAWGVGLAVWGALLASLVGPFADSVGRDPGLSHVFAAVFPGFDFATPGAWLQLYLELFLIVAGFAAATFVSRWASDETDGRLEAVLATPVSRARWVVSGGLGALAAVAVTTLLWVAGIVVGSAASGTAPGDAVLGSASLGLVAAAFVGLGVAVGGLWRASLAAEVTAVVVIATYLVDLLSPPLGLPGWFRGLALTAHMGRPMIGDWDPAGIAACAAVALGGIALGAWGMTRRDVAR